MDWPDMNLYSLNEWTSCYKISWSLEAARLDVIMNKKGCPRCQGWMFSGIAYDVKTWKYSPRYCQPSSRKSVVNRPWTGRFPLWRAGNAGLWVFLWGAPNKSLNQQCSCQWFEMTWSSCDPTEMWWRVFKKLGLWLWFKGGNIGSSSWFSSRLYSMERGRLRNR